MGIAIASFSGDPLCGHHGIKVFPAELLNVQPLHLLPRLGEEDQLRGFAGDLLEHGPLKL